MADTQPPKQKSLKEAFDQAMGTLERMAGIMEKAGLTRESIQLVQFISKEFDLPATDVLSKSLSLFKLAAEQEAKGNRLAFLTPDDEIVTEVPGIREPMQAPEHSDG